MHILCKIKFTLRETLYFHVKYANKNTDNKFPSGDQN